MFGACYIHSHNQGDSKWAAVSEWVGVEVGRSVDVYLTLHCHHQNDLRQHDVSVGGAGG